MSTTGTSTTTASNLTAPTQFLAANGEKYAYRRFEEAFLLTAPRKLMLTQTSAALARPTGNLTFS